MRIAILCTAYVGDPSGIALLAEYFGAIDADLYVHVDKKADIGPYSDLPARCGNVHLLTDRFEYFWGGFNGVRAVVSALTLASHQYDYDRYIYVTEDTVPLVHSRALLQLLAEDVEYFQAEQTSVDWVRRRYDSFFFYDCMQINPKLVGEQDLEMTPEITPEFLDGIARLTALRKRGKFPLRDVYYGFAYFALSRRAVKELLRVYQRNVRLRTSFEFSAIPEEQYFQTVLGGSATQYAFRPFICMDFTGDPKPLVYRTASKLKRLSKLEFPFARKVALGIPEVENFVRRLIDPGMLAAPRPHPSAIIVGGDSRTVER